MQFFPTAVCNVTAWRHSTLRAHWLMALVCVFYWGRSMYSAIPGNCSASPISLLSMGGVCGRSLTAGKILFTGRQTCSLYLVLWLCVSTPIASTHLSGAVVVAVGLLLAWPVQQYLWEGVPQQNTGGSWGERRGHSKPLFQLPKPSV